MLHLAILKWGAAALAGLSGLALAALLGPDHGALPDMGLRPVAMAGETSLLVATQEVTRRQWQACVTAGACPALHEDAVTAGPDYPVTGVNYLDVEAYLGWINQRGDHHYRLPTAEEWNVIAEAMPRKPYKKLFDDPRLAWAANYGTMQKVSAVLRPSGSFGALPNGVADLGGNVWEWTATCTQAGVADDRCPAYMVEGLHETALSVFVRDPANGGCAVGAPPANVGFRLVADE